MVRHYIIISFLSELPPFCFKNSRIMHLYETIIFLLVSLRHKFILKKVCTVGQKIKERNTPYKFNTNCCSEMKLMLINRDYCLFSFDAFKVSERGCLHMEVYSQL